MGFLDRYVDTDKVKSWQVVKPGKVFEEILRQASGTAYGRSTLFDIYYQIYAFYGVVEGVGTSTIVANTALGLAELGLTVCVIDASILTPVQDILLNTSEATYNPDKSVEHLDWFDLPYSKKSVLHVSKFSKNVSVLSFKGKNRGVADFLSPSDSGTLVELALSVLHNKFDLILIDCCHEMSAVNTACLQQAQQVIQVWNDSPVVMSSMENFITNAITLSCPLDKMRYVVYNKVCKDAIGGLDDVLKQYRLRLLGTSYFSEELYLKIVTGKTLFRCESTDQKVIDYTDMIIQIICHLLNIDPDSSKTDKKSSGGFGKALKGDKKEDKPSGTVVQVDHNPMGSPGYGGIVSLDATTGVPVEGTETDAEAQYAAEAMKYGGVMEEDDVSAEDLVDEDGDGVPDIFQNPTKVEERKKKRGFFGRG